MNQSIFIIRKDYFDNPVAGQEFVKKLVEENCKSERIIFIFDPVAEDFFTHVAKGNRELFEQIVKNFYGSWEKSKDTMPLKWYQLDETSTFHVTFLTPVIYNTDDKFCSYIIGCIPLEYESNTLSLYFRISKFETEDIFLIVDTREYMKELETHINRFNEFVRENNRGKNIAELKNT